MSDTQEKTEYTTPEADPTEFRVAATDDKGHSFRGFFYMQPGLHEQVSAIHRSKRFPFRKEGDIYRYAVYKTVRQLLTMKTGIRSVMGQVDLMNELMREDEYQHDFQSFVEFLSKRMAAYEMEGAKDQAKRLLISTLRHIADMPEGYWKDKYDKTVRGKFGTYLTGKDKIDFTKEG